MAGSGAGRIEVPHRTVVRSPDERSDIRDFERLDPGYRYAHPGYACSRPAAGHQ
jgi:hypothetical protein